MSQRPNQNGRRTTPQDPRGRTYHPKALPPFKPPTLVREEADLSSSSDDEETDPESDLDEEEGRDGDVHYGERDTVNYYSGPTHRDQEPSGLAGEQRRLRLSMDRYRPPSDLGPFRSERERKHFMFHEGSQGASFSGIELRPDVEMAEDLFHPQRR